MNQKNPRLSQIIIKNEEILYFKTGKKLDHKKNKEQRKSMRSAANKSFQLEKRVCSAKNCYQEFKVTPNSHQKYCSIFCEHGKTFEELIVASS